MNVSAGATHTGRMDDERQDPRGGRAWCVGLVPWELLLKPCSLAINPTPWKVGLRFEWCNIFKEHTVCYPDVLGWRRTELCCWLDSRPVLEVLGEWLTGWNARSFARGSDESSSKLRGCRWGGPGMGLGHLLQAPPWVMLGTSRVDAWMHGWIIAWALSNAKKNPPTTHFKSVKHNTYNAKHHLEEVCVECLQLSSVLGGP